MLEPDPLRTLVLIGLIVEGAVAVAVLLAAPLRVRVASVVERGLPGFDRLAETRGRAVVVCGVVALAACVFAAAVRPPVPRVHDEFSYLLGADTFAHGRLANPPPVSRELSAHFESEHILVRPTYSSKYPPGQALILAAGQRYFGAAVVGVWLSTALMCGALCWMLQAWTTPRYALLGGLLAALHVGVIGWWGNTYWGGSVAGLGSVLLFGSLRRLGQWPRLRDSVLLGLGVALLAASRPYEGLLACTPAAGALAWLLWRQRRRPAVTLRMIGPAALVLLLAGLGLMRHNQAATGDALTLPYVEHASQYSATPAFLWQRPPEPPAYAHRHLEDFHAGWERIRFERQRGLGSFALISLEKTIVLWLFYAGPAFTLLMLARLRSAGPPREPWTLLALGTCGLVLGGVLLVPWMNPHYLAPILGPAVFLLVRWLQVRERAGTLAAELAVIAPARLAAAASLWPGLLVAYPAEGWHVQRAAIQRELMTAEEPDLVLVRHGRHYRPHEEWVYNGADPAEEPVVWAWELDARRNAALLDRFSERRAWLLDAYRIEPPLLTAYPRPPAWLLRAPASLPVDAAAGALRAADVDQDGLAEILVYGEDESVRQVFAWRDGAFVELPVPSATVAGDAGAALPQDPLRTSVDLDGDGADELIMANPSEDTLTITSSTTLELTGQTVRTGINARRLLAMDVDFDGDQDLVVGSLHGHGISITYNDGGRLRAAPAMVTVGERTWFEDKVLFMDGADVDGDGLPDLVGGGPAGYFVFLTSAGPGEEADGDRSGG